jgi:hypothetical protein
MSDDNTDDALSPDELELDDEHVQRLDENRYVVTVDEKRSPSGGTHGKAGLDSDRTSDAQGLAEIDGAYAFEARGRFEAEMDEIHVGTNDVVDGLESLLRWYAQNVAADTPPEDVVTVLLENSDLDVSVERSEDRTWTQ